MEPMQPGHPPPPAMNIAGLLDSDDADPEDLLAELTTKYGARREVHGELSDDSDDESDAFGGDDSYFQGGAEEAQEAFKPAPEPEPAPAPTRPEDVFKVPNADEKELELQRKLIKEVPLMPDWDSAQGAEDEAAMKKNVDRQASDGMGGGIVGGAAGSMFSGEGGCGGALPADVDRAIEELAGDLALDLKLDASGSDLLSSLEGPASKSHRPQPGRLRSPCTADGFAGGAASSSPGDAFSPGELPFSSGDIEAEFEQFYDLPFGAGATFDLGSAAGDPAYSGSAASSSSEMIAGGTGGGGASSSRAFWGGSSSSGGGGGGGGGGVEETLSFASPPPSTAGGAGGVGSSEMMEGTDGSGAQPLPLRTAADETAAHASPQAIALGGTDRQRQERRMDLFGSVNEMQHAANARVAAGGAAASGGSASFASLADEPPSGAAPDGSLSFAPLPFPQLPDEDDDAWAGELQQVVDDASVAGGAGAGSFESAAGVAAGGMDGLDEQADGGNFLEEDDMDGGLQGIINRSVADAIAENDGMFADD